MIEIVDIIAPGDNTNVPPPPPPPPPPLPASPEPCNDYVEQSTSFESNIIFTVAVPSGFSGPSFEDLVANAFIESYNELNGFESFLQVDNNDNTCDPLFRMIAEATTLPEPAPPHGDKQQPITTGEKVLMVGGGVSAMAFTLIGFGYLGASELGSARPGIEGPVATTALLVAAAGPLLTGPAGLYAVGRALGHQGQYRSTLGTAARFGLLSASGGTLLGFLAGSLVPCQPSYYEEGISGEGECAGLLSSENIAGAIAGAISGIVIGGMAGSLHGFIQSEPAAPQPLSGLTVSSPLVIPTLVSTGAKRSAPGLSIQIAF